MLPIDQELKFIKDRLAKIESYLHIPAPTLEQPKPAATQPLQTLPAQKPAAKGQNETSSSSILGIVAIICFVLAAAFIIKLSIDSGWLTPARQIFIAALFGFILIGSGLMLVDVDREYASQLPSTGIIVLFLSAFAAHRYYHLISFEAGLAITGAISALCIGLYLKIKSEVYPVIAVVGAYLAPSVFGLGFKSEFTLYYFVICSAAFSYLSIVIQSHLLTLIGSYLAILCTALIGQDGQSINNIFLAKILALHFFIYSIGIVIYSKTMEEPLTDEQSWAFFPVLLIFYVCEYYYISISNANIAAWISIGFAVFLILLYLVAEGLLKAKKLPSKPMVMSFAALVFFHAGYIELMPARVGPWLFSALILSAAFLLPRQNVKGKIDTTLVKIVSILFFIIVGIEYFKILSDLITDSSTTPLAAIILAAVSIWVLFISREKYFSSNEVFGYSILGAAHTLVILTIYNHTHSISSLVVSASWLLYGIAIIILGFTRRDAVLANSALFVLGLAASKALLYDAASSPTIVRIICLLLTGVVLYVAGYLFKIIATWNKHNEQNS